MVQNVHKIPVLKTYIWTRRSLWIIIFGEFHFNKSHAKYILKRNHLLVKFVNYHFYEILLKKTYFWTHTEKKLFSCEVWGNEFSQISHLKRQMGIHTVEYTQSWYVCWSLLSASYIFTLYLKTLIENMNYSVTSSLYWLNSFFMYRYIFDLPKPSLSVWL